MNYCGYEHHHSLRKHYYIHIFKFFASVSTIHLSHLPSRGNWDRKSLLHSIVSISFYSYRACSNLYPFVVSSTTLHSGKKRVTQNERYICVCLYRRVTREQKIYLCVFIQPAIITISSLCVLRRAHFSPQSGHKLWYHSVINLPHCAMMQLSFLCHNLANAASGSMSGCNVVFGGYTCSKF